MQLKKYYSLILSPSEPLKVIELLKKNRSVKFVLYGSGDQSDVSRYLLSESSIVYQTIEKTPAKERKRLVPDLCLCGYTKEHECGILDQYAERDTEKSIQLLVQVAARYAALGVEELMESAMLPGLVSALRSEVPKLKIISQALKFDSELYTAFRKQSLGAEGGLLHPKLKAKYQIAIPNRKEALLEALRATSEGADKLVVKPALLSLDIVSSLRAKSSLPIGGFITSAESQILSQTQLVELETGLARAGASFVIKPLAPRSTPTRSSPQRGPSDYLILC